MNRFFVSYFSFEIFNDVVELVEYLNLLVIKVLLLDKPYIFDIVRFYYIAILKKI